MNPWITPVIAGAFALATTLFPVTATMAQSACPSWPSTPTLSPDVRIESVQSEADDRIEYLGAPLPAATTIDHRGEMSIRVSTLETLNTQPVTATLDGRPIDIPPVSQGRCSTGGFAAIECPGGVRPNLLVRQFNLPTQDGGQFTYVVRERDNPSKTHTATIRIR